MKVFFDTSAFIAFFIKEDVKHEEVVEKYKEYKRQRALFLTSDYVLDELYTRLIYDFNKRACKDRIEKLSLAEKNGELKIFNIDNLIFKKALEVFLKFAEHKISFTDATIYVCVKEFKLDEVFTLDTDFKKNWP